jgi:phospholipid/cholesterol/gamma-HCH transport system substrate-binding protein
MSERTGAMSWLDRVVIVPKVIATVAILAVVTALLWAMRPSPTANELTAYFPRTVALYAGSDVKILGVPVGKVERIEPQGDKVKVTMYYESQYDVPADAKAVVISPAVVGDRFVQLTPAYTGGETLKDGAVLDVEQTAVPVELDTIYKSLSDLSVALGPQGANKDGALNRLIEVSAANLEGNGAQMHETFENLSRLTGTLSNNKEELFGTIAQLERFTGMLAKNDKTVRAFNRDLAQVAGFLRGERQNLAASLRNLSRALTSVSAFVNENKQALRDNIKGLKNLTGVLVKQRDALVEIMDVAPLALNNLFLGYNPNAGALHTRSNMSVNEDQLVNDPALVLCAFVAQANNPGEACQRIQEIFARTPTLNRGRPFEYKQIGPVEVEYNDKSLAGLLEVDE